MHALWVISATRAGSVAAAVFALCVVTWTPDALKLIKAANPGIHSGVPVRAMPSLFAAKLRDLSREHPGALALWVRRIVGSDALVAMLFAGRLAYYFEGPVLDTLGLNDVHIAHLPAQQRGIDVKMDPAYVLSRAPELLFVNVDRRYWSGEASFASAGGWKLGDRQLLDLIRRSRHYALVTAPTSICVFCRVHP